MIWPVIANNYNYKNKVKWALSAEANGVFAAMPITKVDYRYGTYWIRGLGDGKFVGYYKVALHSMVNETSVYESKSNLENLLKISLWSRADGIDRQKRDIEEINEDIDSWEGIDTLNPYDIIQIDQSILNKIDLEIYKFLIFKDLNFESGKSKLDKIKEVLNTNSNLLTEDWIRVAVSGLKNLQSKLDESILNDTKVNITVEEISKKITDLYKAMNEMNLSIPEINEIFLEIKIDTIILVKAIAEWELEQLAAWELIWVMEAIYGKLADYKDLLQNWINIKQLVIWVVEAVKDFDEVAMSIYDNLWEAWIIIKELYNAGWELWENTSAYEKWKIFGLIKWGLAVEVFDPLWKIKILEKLKTGQVQLGVKMQELIQKIKIFLDMHKRWWNLNYASVDGIRVNWTKYMTSIGHIDGNNLIEEEKALLEFMSKKWDVDDIELNNRVGSLTKLSNVVAGIPKVSLDRVKKRCLGLEDREYKIYDVKVFGSRTRDDYRPDSDVDMVIIVSSSNAKYMRESDDRIIQIRKSIVDDFKKETWIRLDLNIHDKEEIWPKTKFEFSDLKSF